MSQAAIEFEDLELDEEWRDIPGYPGYQASNLGRIRSNIFGNYKFFKPNVTSKGYLAVALGDKRKKSIHRLVLLSFIGKPKLNEQGDHINRNKTDNRLCNLRWISTSANLANRNNWGKSKYYGVNFRIKKKVKKDGTVNFYTSIRSAIRIEGKIVFLGTFKTEEEAHEAYKTAYKNHYGYEWTE
jgi:hypothetical protein